MKIAHLTSAHPRYDNRIYYKMCCSLSSLGEVYLVCADGRGDEIVNNVNILGIDKSKSRIQRMITTVNSVYKKAIDLDADIYHLHDPELIRIGLKLIEKNKKVIFDSHELVGDQILSKKYLPKFSRNAISKIYNYYEKYSLKKFNLIGATPHIKDHLKTINKDTIDIINYPLLDGHTINKIEASKQSDRVKYICYVGDITINRGIKELVEALELTSNKVVLNLAGNFSPLSLEKEIRNLPGWKNVNYLGYLKKEQVNSVYANSFAGIVTLHPTLAYINSLPTKMFEYMSFKLPIIASDFELFCKIFDQVGCGLNVDPCNPKKIAEAIDKLIDESKKSKKFGENGYRAFKREFNWKFEEKKLFSFYKKVANS